MVALRLLGAGRLRSGNVVAGVASCRSRPVQSVSCVKQRAPNRQPPVSPFSKGESNRMAGGLCRTFRLLSLFFILVMPSVFLADTANAAWGTATVDNTGDTGQYTSIAVGTSGAAYISYQDVTNTALMYATNVSGAWGTTTVDNTSSANTGSWTSIAVGTSGAAYISYQDRSEKPLVEETSGTRGWGCVWGVVVLPAVVAPYAPLTFVAYMRAVFVTS